MATNFLIKYPAGLGGATAWDCGREPLYSGVRDGDFKTINARQIARKFEISWDGVSVAQVALFIENVARISDSTYFVLYDTNDYVLDGWDSINARLISYDIAPSYLTSTIRARFEEVI